MTASRLPGATWTFAGRASFWARASRGRRCCVLPIWQTDTGLLDWAREVAPLMLDQHPDLAERHVLRWLGGKAEFLKA